MALRLGPKLKTLGSGHSLRPSHSLSSSSSSSPSSSSPPHPPASDGDGGDDAQPPSYASLFSEIKARLKQAPPSPPRRIPLSPPDPPLGSELGPPSAAAASLEEIRRNLSGFGQDRKPPLSSSPSISFRDIYKSSVLDRADDAGAGAPGGPSFESIRESLRQLRTVHPPTGSQPGFGRWPRGASQGGPSHPLDLRSLKDRLSLRGGEPAGGPQIGGGELPLDSKIFGRELLEKEREQEGGKESAVRKTEFLKTYNFEELGLKLRMLRPEEVEAGKKNKGWFSLEELNERLVKLRELEEKETKYSIGGLSFIDLRESLVKLRDSTKKTSSMAQLTTRIRYLEPILYTKKKGKGLKGPDKHSIKGLVAMVKRRNKLLKYLRRTDWESYCMVLSKLELRDIDKREVKGMKGSKEKKRGKKGKGKYSKKANYET